MVLCALETLGHSTTEGFTGSFGLRSKALLNLHWFTNGFIVQLFIIPSGNLADSL